MFSLFPRKGGFHTHAGEIVNEDPAARLRTSNFFQQVSVHVSRGRPRDVEWIVVDHLGGRPKSFEDNMRCIVAELAATGSRSPSLESDPRQPLATLDEPFEADFELPTGTATPDQSPR